MPTAAGGDSEQCDTTQIAAVVEESFTPGPHESRAIEELAGIKPSMHDDIIGENEFEDLTMTAQAQHLAVPTAPRWRAAVVVDFFDPLQSSDACTSEFS